MVVSASVLAVKGKVSEVANPSVELVEIRKSAEEFSVIFPASGVKYLAETEKLRLESIPVFTKPKLIEAGFTEIIEISAVFCSSLPIIDVR